MISLGNVTPVLRVFDERKAKESYIGFLGFKIDFEHRFEDNFPLCMGVSLSGCSLHLEDAVPETKSISPARHAESMADGLAQYDLKSDHNRIMISHWRPCHVAQIRRTSHHGD